MSQTVIRFMSSAPDLVWFGLMCSDVGLSPQSSADSYELQEGSTSDLLNARVSGEIMSLVLMRYQGRDWHGHIRIEKESPEFFAVCLTCDSDTSMTLDVSVHVTRTASRLLLSLFSPYWIINKTSRVLQYRAEDVNVKHPADCRDIILFSFRKKNLFSKSKVSKHLDRFRYVRLSIKRSTPVITQPLIQRQCLDNRILSPESFRSHQTFGFASKFVCLYLHHKRFMLVLQNIWVCTDWFDLIEPLNKNLRVAVCRSSSCVSPPAPGLMPSLWTRWEVTAVFAVPPTTWTSW